MALLATGIVIGALLAATAIAVWSISVLLAGG